MSTLKFIVMGIPVPQGSKRAYNNVVVDSNSDRLRPWRQMVSAEARDAMGEPWKDGTSGFKVSLWFWFPRPKNHYNAKGELRASKADVLKIGRPDADKLTRAALDSLTDAGVWLDDSQVVEIHAYKRYSTLGGLDVEVARIQVTHIEEGEQ